ncbi:MAG: septum formation initiator family protein [Paludibacteraceae bacterium]|mgnify:FL=1|jgi:cell division protein FtsB|nr:septum formation initiator family protein [Paludibacteraceae bacterium]MBO5988897.1 septum formation initiator family protein [Paludibacteraceae bacterium]
MKLFLLKAKDILLKIDKHILVLVCFGVWMLFFDQNNFFKREELNTKIDELNEQISFYKNDIEKSIRETNELKSNVENLEKFAREKYLMKKSDEVIFLVSD